VKFCKLIAIPDFNTPPTNKLFLLFISYLANNRKFGYNGIKTYISGIRYWCNDKGYPDPTFHNNNKWHRYKQLLAGIKRLHARRKRIRKPLKLSAIKKLLNVLPTCFTNKQNQVSFKAALLMGYFGFMRCSEYLFKNLKSKFLRRKDVKLYPHFKKFGIIKIRLRKTKTEQYNSTYVTIYGNGKDTCPFKAIKQYLDLASLNKDSPLFMLGKKPLTPRVYNIMLRRGLAKIKLNPKHYSSHSLRSGAASQAADAGAPGWVIQKSGRWRSDCFKIYIPKPVKQIRLTQKLIA